MIRRESRSSSLIGRESRSSLPDWTITRSTILIGLAAYAADSRNKKTPNIWAAGLESLLTQPPNPVNQQALENLLDQMSRTFPPEHLAEILPAGEEFQQYLTESKRIHQAAKMQELIVATGQKLLESLTL